MTAALRDLDRKVVDAIVGAGLATVKYELRPLASLKGAESR